MNEQKYGSEISKSLSGLNQEIIRFIDINTEYLSRHEKFKKLIEIRAIEREMSTIERTKESLSTLLDKLIDELAEECNE